MATQLAPEHWHYHVVNFGGNETDEISILQHVLGFKSKELFLAITLLDNGGTSAHVTKTTHTMMTMLRGSGYQMVDEITPQDAAWISKWHQKIKAVAHDKRIMAALKRRQELFHLPLFSTAHVLGLFSILEMLLTHQQRDKNLHDSLTHQVATKMSLLNRRFERSALYHFFPGVPMEDVWRALYEYRSRIAHGNDYDFGSSKLSKLQSESLAHGFLNDAVGLLLRLWIDDPEFVTDLKKC